jgi:Ca2+-transporting ATPase
MSLLETGVLCNNASLGRDADMSGVGNPLEMALLEVGRKAGIERDQLIRTYPEAREESFDPSVKMMATFHEDSGGYRVTVKGAPEAVLDACSQIQSGADLRPLTEEDRQAWNDKNACLAKRGLRILAMAMKGSASPRADPYTDLVFLGLVAMADPPRAEVVQAIRRCRSAGMRVVMVTGDQTATAASIAKAVGLSGKEEGETFEGRHIRPPEELTEAHQQRLRRGSVFARVSPEQKLRLISLHKDAGSIVAMTGDGVNDAPALKKADIGVAMGQRGTQVACDAADMILKDDAFSSIVVAVEQGRIIFNNIRKFVLYLLSGNASEIFIVFLASLLNWPLPILPLQILFLNVINDVFPALALGLGEGETDTMAQPPRDPQEAVLAARCWWAIFGYGALITGPVLASFWFATATLDASEEEAVTVSFLTLAFARLWHIFNIRSPGSGLLRNEITTNRYVWAALLLCSTLLVATAYVPGLSTVLSLTYLRPAEWVLICAFSLIPLLMGQAIKTLRRLVTDRNAQ